MPGWIHIPNIFMNSTRAGEGGRGGGVWGGLAKSPPSPRIFEAQKRPRQIGLTQNKF